MKRTGLKNSSKRTNRKNSFEKSTPRSLKKQYLRSKDMCKVTFRLPKEAAPDAKVVTLVGDFNGWDKTKNPMKRLKNGDFSLTLCLPCNREYRFRYLIDSSRWENDWFADKYVPNAFGSDDSVVIVGNGK